MPIYEYICMPCERHFEELVRNSEDPLCPDCGSARVAKQVSVFARRGREPALRFPKGTVGAAPPHQHPGACGCCAL